MKEFIYSWKFSLEKERSQFWYILAFAIVIGLVIWGFITRLYSMSFVILLVSGLYLFVENNSESEIIVNIKELGITVGTNFYDYSKIKSFTIIYEGENAVILRLKMIAKGIRIIDLKVDNNIVKELKNILPNFIEEDPKEELSFSEKLINFLNL